jgi:hypothetical protein
MAEEKKCSDCQHSNDCKSAYEQLGCVEGPNVALKVFVAFLLPILVFIIAFAVLEDVFSMFLNSENIVRVLTLLSAVTACLTCMFITKEKKDQSQR